MEAVDKKGEKIPPKNPKHFWDWLTPGRTVFDIQDLTCARCHDPEQMKQLLFAMTPLEDTMTYDFRALNDHTISAGSYAGLCTSTLSSTSIWFLNMNGKNKNRAAESKSYQVVSTKVVNEDFACARVNGRARKNRPRKREKNQGAEKYHKTDIIISFYPNSSREYCRMPA